MTSPTARSLKKLRDEGWTAEVVEKWISYRDTKLDAKLWTLIYDMLGAASLVATRPDDSEKALRLVMAIDDIRNLAKLYKPPVMPGIRKDAFGFGDILAFHEPIVTGPILYRVQWKPVIMIVQATSFANLNARIAKAKVIPAFGGWLAAGGLVEFHGWRVRKLKRGDGSTCKVVRFPET